MSPLPVTASERQKLAEAALLSRIESKRRQNLERRISNGLTKEQEQAIIDGLNEKVRDHLEKRLRAIRSNLPKVKLYMGNMASWYVRLPSIKKKKLTDRDLKRRALGVCARYGIEYGVKELPLDWIDQLREKVGLTFIRTVRPGELKRLAAKMN